MHETSERCDAAELSRRDLLRITAAGAMAPALLTAAEAADGGPFVVRPYVQLGDAPRASPNETLTLMWQALPGRGTWSVDFRTSGDANWVATDRVTRVAVTWDPLESTCRHASLSIL